MDVRCVDAPRRCARLGVRPCHDAGLRLVELVRLFTCVIIIVDALQDPADAGRGPEHRLGIDMPEEVVVVAIEATDVQTFERNLTPTVPAAERARDLPRREVAA